MNWAIYIENKNEEIVATFTGDTPHDIPDQGKIAAAVEQACSGVLPENPALLAGDISAEEAPHVGMPDESATDLADDDPAKPANNPTATDEAQPAAEST